MSDGHTDIQRCNRCRERHHLKAKLTGTGDNRNVAKQAKDLWAEEGTIPNTEEFVEKSL